MIDKTVSNKATILVLHGPNLNLLGKRQPNYYGETPLESIDTRLRQRASESGRHCETLQSNNEAMLIDRVQLCINDSVGFIIFNPAALTHTSIALRDALLAAATPFIEVHLSNLYTRESFRQHSYFSDIAVGSIYGLGALGYDFALDYALNYLNNQAET